MFGRATIRLGVGPHSSCFCIAVVISAVIYHYCVKLFFVIYCLYVFLCVVMRVSWFVG